MNAEILTTLVGTGAAAAGSIVTWLLGRHRENVEVNNAAISGMQEALKFYTELSTDTKKRLEEVVKERNDLSDKIEQQGKELAQVKAELLRLSVSLCYNMSCEIRKNYQAEEKPKPKTKPKKDEANK